uniref:NAD(P)-binding protein n=1 Tax=Panagrolaimus sp. PS1159 TaxID=55785 RepID=A0AC35G320_9BILA
MAALRSAAASNAQILAALTPPPNVVVVGGTAGIAGIGRAIALSIGKYSPSANITIIGRNQSAADSVLATLGSRSKFLAADASLMSEIHASLMSEIRNVTKKIDAVDILVLTQGILTMNGRTPTKEDIDTKLALHFYGRMLFVQELLPLLRQSPSGGKVLFVLDSVNGNPSKVNWDDMALEKTYSLMGAAMHATTFTDVMIQYFASKPENENITFTHAYPGAVRTTLSDSLPFYLRIPAKAVMALGVGTSPEDCAEYMVHGLLETKKGFRYVDNKGEPVTKAKQIDSDMINKVWEHTSQIISR